MRSASGLKPLLDGVGDCGSPVDPAARHFGIAMAHEALGKLRAKGDPSGAADHFDLAGRALEAYGATLARSLRLNDFRQAGIVASTFARADTLVRERRADAPLARALHFARQGGREQGETMGIFIVAPLSVEGFVREVATDARRLSERRHAPATRMLASLTLAVLGDAGSLAETRARLVGASRRDFEEEGYRAPGSSGFRRLFDPDRISTPRDDLLRLKKYSLGFGGGGTGARIASACVSLAMGDALLGRHPAHAIVCYSEAMASVPVALAPDLHASASWKRAAERVRLRERTGGAATPSSDGAGNAATIADLRLAASLFEACEDGSVRLPAAIRGAIRLDLGRSLGEVARSEADAALARDNLERAVRYCPDLLFDVEAILGHGPIEPDR